MRLISIFISISVLFLCGICVATTREQPVDWQTWTPDIFHRAEAEHKFVLLDLGTQWCHWCHVMDVQTYADPRVRKLIAEKYIAVRMDADERPDFGNRYEDYGWPATVVYNAQGGEIVKRQGFLSPGEMASMLAAIIADPTPGPSVTPTVKVRFGDHEAASGDLRLAAGFMGARAEISGLEQHRVGDAPGEARRCGRGADGPADADAAA